MKKLRLKTIRTPWGTLKYMLRVPASAEQLPAGYIVVHNAQIESKDGKHHKPLFAGSRIISPFNAWLEESPARPELAPCLCGWAPWLGPHWVVARAPDAASRSADDDG